MLKQSQEGMSCTLDSISHSAAQTQRLGMRLGELLRGGELILLNGQLGTGKTTFTQGLAQGMGISANINSPTFTLLKEYAGRLEAQPGNGKTLRTEDRRFTISICTGWTILKKSLILALRSILPATAYAWWNGLRKPNCTGRLTTSTSV